MLKAYGVIRGEDFDPQIETLLLNILDDTCAGQHGREGSEPRALAAALCALARAGQHSPDRLRRYAASVVARSAAR